MDSFVSGIRLHVCSHWASSELIGFFEARGHFSIARVVEECSARFRYETRPWEPLFDRFDKRIARRPSPGLEQETGGRKGSPLCPLALVQQSEEPLLEAVQVVLVAAAGREQDWRLGRMDVQGLPVDDDEWCSVVVGLQCRHHVDQLMR